MNEDVVAGEGTVAWWSTTGPTATQSPGSETNIETIVLPTPEAPAATEPSTREDDADGLADRASGDAPPPVPPTPSDFPGGGGSPTGPSQMRRLWPVLVSAAAVILLVVAVVAWVNVSHQNGTIRGLRANLATLNDELSATQDAVTSDQQQIQNDQQQIQSADARAKAAADAAYRQRLAAVQSREAAVGQREAQVQAATAAQQATTIGGDGLYVVGRDIVPGLYHADAPAGSCYWARLSSTNPDSVDSIIANDNSTGPVTVQIYSSDVAFQTKGCSSFVKVG